MVATHDVFGVPHGKLGLLNDGVGAEAALGPHGQTDALAVSDLGGVPALFEAVGEHHARRQRGGAGRSQTPGQGVGAGEGLVDFDHVVRAAGPLCLAHPTHQRGGDGEAAQFRRSWRTQVAVEPVVDLMPAGFEGRTATQHGFAHPPVGVARDIGDTQDAKGPGHAVLRRRRSARPPAAIRAALEGSGKSWNDRSTANPLWLSKADPNSLITTT